MSDQAVKIFEALSDVDEELLERCNQTAVRKNGGAYRLFQRYGRAMAAGLCLVVVGAVSWGGYFLVAKNTGSDSSANGAAELSQMAQSMAVAEESELARDCGGAGNNLADGTAGAAAGMAEDTNAAVEGGEAQQEVTAAQTESDSLGIAGAATSQEEAKLGNTQQMQTSAAPADGAAAEAVKDRIDKVDQYAALREQETDLIDSRKEIPWGEACATEPFSSYLPTVLPAGYEAFCARRSAFPEKWDNLIFKWTDGEYILWLNMTQGEVVTREDIKRRDGLNEYVAEDFRKELILTVQPADDPISFTLYYADGMRIDFSGYITADEMWEVVSSIQK